MADYSSGMDRPYDSVMNRVPGGTSPVVNQVSSLFNYPIGSSSLNDPTVAGTSTVPSVAAYSGMQNVPTVAGPVETKPVSTPGGIEDLWIRSFLRSTNYKPNAIGFNIDGSTGRAEFQDIVARGSISSGQTAYNTGVGFWIGTDSGTPKMSIGDPNANHLTWDGTELQVVGRISAINAAVATCFENTSRFDTKSAGSANVVFTDSGLTMATGATANSYAYATWAAMPANVFRGNPVFSTSLNVPSAGTTFMGLGSMTAAALNLNANHIGFKIVGGSLYATQADGTTETALLLSDAARNDTFNLVIKVNGTTSVDYYFRRYFVSSTGTYNDNFSAVSTLTSHMPISSDNVLTFRIDNLSSAANYNVNFVAASYIV